MARQPWSNCSTAHRSRAAQQRFTQSPPEKVTKSEIGVLHFDEYGRVNDMSTNDPTNFDARVAAATQALDEHTAALKPSNCLAASAAVNDFTKHPQRWLTTPAHGIQQAREIRFEEIRIGHTLNETERREYLIKLVASK